MSSASADPQRPRSRSPGRKRSRSGSAPRKQEEVDDHVPAAKQARVDSYTRSTTAGSAASASAASAESAGSDAALGAQDGKTKKSAPNPLVETGKTPLHAYLHKIEKVKSLGFACWDAKAHQSRYAAHGESTFSYKKHNVALPDVAHADAFLCCMEQQRTAAADDTTYSRPPKLATTSESSASGAEAVAAKFNALCAAAGSAGLPFPSKVPPRLVGCNFPHTPPLFRSLLAARRKGFDPAAEKLDFLVGGSGLFALGKGGIDKRKRYSIQKVPMAPGHDVVLIGKMSEYTSDHSESGFMFERALTKLGETGALSRAQFDAACRDVENGGDSSVFEHLQVLRVHDSNTTAGAYTVLVACEVDACEMQTGAGDEGGRRSVPVEVKCTKAGNWAKEQNSWQLLVQGADRMVYAEKAAGSATGGGDGKGGGKWKGGKNADPGGLARVDTISAHDHLVKTCAAAGGGPKTAQKVEDNIVTALRTIKNVLAPQLQPGSVYELDFSEVKPAQDWWGAGDWNANGEWVAAAPSAVEKDLTKLKLKDLTAVGKGKGNDGKGKKAGGGGKGKGQGKAANDAKKMALLPRTTVLEAFLRAS